MIFIGIGLLDGVQCDSKTETAESHWLSQFSHWRTNLRDHASVTLTNFLNGNAGRVTF